MKPEETQVENDLTTNELASALGFSTKISEDWLMSQAPQEEAPMEQETATETPMVEPEEAPVEEEPQEDKDMMEEHKKMIDEEVKKQVEAQLGPIKEALQKALEEDTETED